MAKVCCDLLHLHVLADGGSETKWLLDRKDSDERVIIPEAASVGHRRVALSEEVFELVCLEIV